MFWDLEMRPFGIDVSEEQWGKCWEGGEGGMAAAEEIGGSAQEREERGGRGATAQVCLLFCFAFFSFLKLEKQKELRCIPGKDNLLSKTHYNYSFFPGSPSLLKRPNRFAFSCSPVRL